MSDFPTNTGEWLAEQAYTNAGRDYAVARERLVHALAALDLWASTQPIANDNDDCGEPA